MSAGQQARSERRNCRDVRDELIERRVGSSGEIAERWTLAEHVLRCACEGRNDRMVGRDLGCREPDLELELGVERWVVVACALEKAVQVRFDLLPRHTGKGPNIGEELALAWADAGAEAALHRESDVERRAGRHECVWLKRQ